MKDCALTGAFFRLVAGAARKSVVADSAEIPQGRISVVLSLQVPIENKLKKTLIGSKIRTPKAGDHRRQVNESEAGGQSKHAQCALNRHPPPFGFAARRAIINEQHVRMQFFCKSDGLAFAGPQRGGKPSGMPLRNLQLEPIGTCRSPSANCLRGGVRLA
jgi:hypothetical protein